MTLGTKTLAIIAATVAAAALIAYVVSSQIMMSSFCDLQRSEVRLDVQRTAGALQNDLNNISSTVEDWAHWDDTYRFAGDLNPAYIRSNLAPTTFAVLHLDHIVFLDTSGRVIFDLTTRETKRGTELVSDPTARAIARAVKLIKPKGSAMNPVSGMVVINGIATLLAGCPIMTSTKQGPSRGTLIMARHLDAEEIRQLSRTVRMPVAIGLLNDPKMPADFRRASDALRKESTYVAPLGRRRTAGYTQLRDVLGRPALILRVDVPSLILAEGRRSVRLLLISLLTVGALFVLASMLITHRAVLARLARIRSGLRNIGRTGDLSERLAVNGSDEIAEAADTINWMLESLSKAHDELEDRVEQRTAELVQAREWLQQAFEREHHIAEVLQRSLIEPVDITQPEYEIAARFQPGRTEANVGGDFYDVFCAHGNRRAAVIGDVSGKGLPAAVFTSMAKYMLRAYAHDSQQPAEVMQKLNGAVCDYTPEDMFITIFLGFLDSAAGTFSYANAGHDYPLHFVASEGRVAELGVTGPVVCLDKGTPYDVRTTGVAAGDALMLYTDGITDARNGGPPLGIRGLADVFRANAHGSAREIVDAAFDAASQAAQGSWPDDAAVLVIKIGHEWGIESDPPRM